VPKGLVKVVINGLEEYPLKPVTLSSTDIGWKVAPDGTVTVKLVVIPVVIAALTAPKYTMLLAGTALKFVPVIVTLVPTGPLEGVKELIVGCAVAFTAIKRKKANNVLRKAGIK
jgi:hypothetical protein